MAQAAIARVIQRDPLIASRLRDLGLIDGTPIPSPGGQLFKVGVIGANVLAYLSWNLAEWLSRSDESGDGNRNLLEFLKDNFLLTLQNLRKRRWWTAITCAVSHHDFGHFLGNMASFDSYADLALRSGMSATGLIVLSLGSIATGSFFLARDWMRASGNRNYNTRSSSRRSMVADAGLGASALVSGLATAVTLMTPNALVRIPPFPPVRLWLFTLAYISYNLIGSARQKRRSGFPVTGNDQPIVGHVAHLGGTMFGAAYYFFAAQTRYELIPSYEL